MPDVPSPALIEYALCRVACCTPDGIVRLMAAEVNPRHFATRMGRALYAAALALHMRGVPPTPVLVLDEIGHGAIGKRYKVPPDVLEQAAALLSDGPYPYTEEHVVRLKRKATRKSLEAFIESTMTTLGATADDEIDALLSEVGRKVLSLTAQTDEAEDTDPYTQFRAWATAQRFGLASGFSFYDRSAPSGGLGGLAPGVMTTMTAPSGEGKSTISISIMANLIRFAAKADLYLKAQEQGTPAPVDEEIGYLLRHADDHGEPVEAALTAHRDCKIICFTTEMEAGYLHSRIMSALTNLSMTEIRNEGWGAAHQTILGEWWSYLKGRLVFYGKTNIVSEMVQKVAIQRAHWGMDVPVVVIIDHFHHVSGLFRSMDQNDVKGNLNAWYREMYEMGKRMTQDYNLHLLAFDQVADRLRDEFRSTNDVNTLSFKDSGDSFNVTDNALIFGKSKDKKNASVGWVKKVRRLEDSRVFELPFYLEANVRRGVLHQVTAPEYRALAERTDKP